MNAEKIISIVLSISAIIIVVDAILASYNINTKPTDFVLAYCIAFVFSSIKFPNILKKKHVVIPIYLMVAQTIYSLITRYIK